ncbi:MAG: hypothetical protein HNEKOMLI_00809 [Sodalis sp. Psp]|nr:hypothetical protein [Sodalis sp. Psp]MCR3757213.1 hypothetical protein [Sodalis sp. Ppy]
MQPPSLLRRDNQTYQRSDAQQTQSLLCLHTKDVQTDKSTVSLANVTDNRAGRR